MSSSPIPSEAMSALGSYVLVFTAGFLTAVATGFGTVPFFFLDDVSDALHAALWGFAGGLMTSASVFGLLFEAWRSAALPSVAAGLAAGALLVVVAHGVIDRLDIEYNPADLAEEDLEVLVPIFLVLLVHSFPEGLAVGVAFAELDLTTGIPIFGMTVPVIAAAMTITISIHNVPEGVAVGVPLAGEGVSPFWMFSAAVFTSLPQPVGAVIAFAFVQLAEQFLGFGYGLAAGAMLYLVADDIVPEGLSVGSGLPGGGRRHVGGGFLVGVLGMVPLLFLL